MINLLNQLHTGAAASKSDTIFIIFLMLSTIKCIFSIIFMSKDEYFSMNQPWFNEEYLKEVMSEKGIIACYWYLVMSLGTEMPQLLFSGAVSR